MQLYNFLLIPAFHICNLFFVSCYSVAYIILENQSCGLNIKLTVTDTLHCNMSIVFLHEPCNSVTLNLKEKQVNTTAFVKVKIITNNRREHWFNKQTNDIPLYILLNDIQRLGQNQSNDFATIYWNRHVGVSKFVFVSTFNLSFITFYIIK